MISVIAIIDIHLIKQKVVIRVVMHMIVRQFHRLILSYASPLIDEKFIIGLVFGSFFFALLYNYTTLYV